MMNSGKPIDKQAIANVLALNDEQLKQAIHALAAAGGMDERRAALISRDTDKIRKRLGSVTEADLERLLSGIDEKQLQAIAGQLKGLL